MLERLAQSASLSGRRWTPTTHTRSSAAGSGSGPTRRRSRRRIPATRRRPTAAASRTCSRCCRTPPARCTWATCSSTRSATSSRTSAGATGCSVLRPMGWDSFGLPAENAAIREGGHPREIVERNIDSIRSTMQRVGWAIDWTREVRHARARVLPLDAVAVPAALRRRARLPQEGAGQVVPERPDRAGERAGQGRPLRALRRRGDLARPGAVVLQDDRLRRRAARRDGRARLAGADPGDAAALDRPLARRRGRCSASTSSTSTSPSSRRGPTRSSARPSSCSRRSTRWSSRSPSARSTATRSAPTCSARPRSAPRSAPPRRRSPASSPASSSRTRSTRRACRSGSPTTC